MKAMKINNLTLIAAIGLILFSLNAVALIPHVQVAPEKRSYSCSLTVNRLMGKKVLVDLRDFELNFTKVAKDQDDWSAYQEVFEGLSKTIQEDLRYPIYFTARLVPQKQSGAQDVAMELSFQRFNKMKESRMEPIAEARGAAGQRVEVTQFDREKGMKMNFSCTTR